jgi:hypothetical protein
VDPGFVVEIVHDSPQIDRRALINRDNSPPQAAKEAKPRDAPVVMDTRHPESERTGHANCADGRSACRLTIEATVRV